MENISDHCNPQIKNLSVFSQDIVEDIARNHSWISKHC